MENVNFQPSGEEIERALMDLGPLLGVTIKEEAPEELADPSAQQQPAPLVVGSASTEGAGGGSETGAGADSLASPGARSPGGVRSPGEAPGGRTPPWAARCVLCRTPLVSAEGTPKLMECLHSACEPCIKAKIDERQSSSRDFLGAERITVTCPECRLQCQPANMIDQRFVLEKIADEQIGPNGGGGPHGDFQCNSCEDTEPATSYCVDCAEFICDNCVNAHQRLKITKDHTIKSKEAALSSLQAATPARSAQDMFCPQHPQERLSLFCETCDRLTCRDCQLHHHRDHKYQFSAEMAAQARGSISALLSEVSYKRVLLGSAMKVIRDRQQLIADKKKALVHEITQMVVKLTNAINTRCKQLVLRLNEVCDGKLRTLGEKKEALEQLAAMTDHCVRFVGGALDNGSDTALLHAKRPLSLHLQRIKQRRADIPNPDIPVRISLALDKLPDLIRVLSSIGAIVVDGKVDGGAGGAQGPYHPPAGPGGPPPGPGGPPPGPPAPHHAAPTSAQSAVVALQHVAMHQSFVGGAAAGYLSPLRARHATPLRHAHVTSTTHPHHLHGMSEMNLRGLLNAAGARAQPRPLAQSNMHHTYHQMLGAYASGAFPGSGRRSGGARTPSPAPPAYPPPAHPPPAHHAQPAAKWHIPQHALSNGGLEAGSSGMGGGGAGPDFKITLGRPGGARPALPPAVTSTNPKTPSPSLNGGASLELDKVIAESVQDLMATIAKLDSNGVQVVAEAARPAPPAPSPHVHSSTDPDLPGKAGAASGGASDPNEDWCAVCMDGGELMCCDKCPKVFHQYCHIPTIEKLPDETETWQCLLCVNFAELGEDGGGAEGGGLSARQLKLVERLTLELYCQYEPSLPFREPVPPDNLHYHATVARPMCLDMIRMKLQPRAPMRYTHVSQFVADCRLLFRNAYSYNPVESQIYKDAKRLEEFFDAQLMKWLPEYVYWRGDGDPPAKRPRRD